MSGRIQAAVDDRVLHLTITNLEQANALTPMMLEELTGHLSSAATDDTLRVVVLRGAGGSFSAGYAISSFPEPDHLQESDELTAAGAAMAACPKATIAILEGSAIGAALDLALAADFRVGSADLRAGITPARFGIIYPWQGISRLVDRVGERVARRLLLTAEILDGETALQFGLLDELASPDGLEAAAEQWVQRLLRAAPLSVAGTKVVLDALGGGGSKLEADLAKREEILRLRRAAIGSVDAREAAAAFSEKRPAAFIGR